MHRHALALLVALALAAVFAGPAAAAPSSGAAIRASLPAVNQPFTPGTVQFAGQDATKRFNVAVVRGAKGAVLAYVCNGTSIGRWFTGRVAVGPAELTGKGGTLTVRFRDGRAVGSATLGATTIRFSLPRATGFSGLRRAVAKAGGRRFEAAWIVTASGVTRGLASEDGGKTVATSSSTNSPEGPDAGVTPGGGGTPPEPSILNRFRCNRIVLAYSQLKLALASDPGNAEIQAEMDKLNLRHRQLACDAFIRL